MSKKIYPLAHLLRNRDSASAIGRTKSLIIAISTSAPAHRTVAIGTGKARINCNLLHLTPEAVAQKSTKIIIVETSIVHRANITGHEDTNKRARNTKLA